MTGANLSSRRSIARARATSDAACVRRKGGGARSRRKGATWERQLAVRFREVLLGAEVRRGFQFRSGGEAADVSAPYFHIEAKHHHQVNIRAAMRQAIVDCSPGKWPVVVSKDDRAEPLATMRRSDLIALVGCTRTAPTESVPCLWVWDQRFYVHERHGRRIPMRAAMLHAIRMCPPGRWAVLLCNDDGAEAIATMRLDDFLELVGEWWKGQTI